METKNNSKLKKKINIMEKRIKGIIKADLANAREGFENIYLLDRDNWIEVCIHNGHLEIGDHINGEDFFSEAIGVDYEKNFDAAWEEFIEDLKKARKIRWKRGERKISLGIKNFLIRLGELEFTL